MNNNITQADIAEFHTSQPDDNSILAQVQMSRMGRQRGVIEVSTNNAVAFTRLGNSKFSSIQ